MSDNLYVNRLEVSNFMRVEAATVDAHGNTVVISGSNAVGKTASKTTSQGKEQEGI